MWVQSLDQLRATDLNTHSDVFLTSSFLILSILSIPASSKVKLKVFIPDTQSLLQI